MSDANLAKRETWESLKAAGFGDWVKEDKQFQRLVSMLVENFGALETSVPDDTSVFPYIPDKKAPARRGAGARGVSKKR